MAIIKLSLMLMHTTNTGLLYLMFIPIYYTTSLLIFIIHKQYPGTLFCTYAHLYYYAVSIVHANSTYTTTTRFSFNM